ncbi:MAG: hypothetical protein FJ288_03615 [Planctomycetes bacterium]|nr:hypothetical protein [Planctomycetota bacterium]
MAASSQPRKRWAVDRQQLLILMAAAVMLASFVLLVLWPHEEELAALGSEVSRRRDLVSQKVRVSQEGLYVSAQIAGMRRMHDRLLARLPEDARLSEFLESVAALVGAEPGVAHEISRTDEPPTGPVPAARLRLRLTGPFEAVYRCLAGIEGLERLNQVHRLHVWRASDGGDVTAEADVLVFYLPQEDLPPGLAPRATRGSSGNQVERPAGAVRG